MERVQTGLLTTCYALIPTLGVLWILSVPQYFGFAVVGEEAVSVILGLAAAAAFIKFPYGERPGVLDLALGLAAMAAWFWAAAHYEAWIIGMADRTPDKWVPGLVGLLLLMEALRKTSGLPIAILVWILIAYAFLGHLLPGVFEAEAHPATKIILYNYADSNGVPGLVLRVVCTIVLAFIILGKLLEVSGATRFFTDLALAWMGHRRGGPAKVSVVASSAFGMVSGSTVGNIMSTGVVSIPLMKSTGFTARHAAAIEAVASNGGQIAPPVMGATAFLIAEFLDVPYADVVIAAAVPALLYYVVLFIQVDAIAARFGLKGLARSELPAALAVLARGWIFLLPIGVLLYYLFWLGYTPSLAALYAIGTLLVLVVIQRRRLLTWAELKEFVLGSGENLLPLVMIGAGAGVVIGVMNSTGLGFQLALVLAQIGENWGLFAMLVVTAMLSIILGMGMPTAAVYILLSIVLAPAMEKMGVQLMAAHLFLFYFGLLSMLTPPVAVASYVAAGMAGSNMWSTAWVGMQLAAAAYLLPFLWIYNPALLFIGTWQEVGLAIASALAGALLLARAIQDFKSTSVMGIAGAGLTLVLGLLVGSATIWIGTASPWVLLAIAVGLTAWFYLRARGADRAAEAAQSVPGE